MNAFEVNFRKTTSFIVCDIISKDFKCKIFISCKIVNIIIVVPLGNPLLVIPVAFPCVSSPPEGNYTCLVQI